jgi:hypothetical protein
VFQVHGIDAQGNAVIRKTLRRAHMLHSLRSFRRVWWAWKLAVRRITGRANS